MIETLNHKVLSFGIIVVLPLLIFSCVSIQKYPSEWPPLISIENDKCHNISGTYENEGQWADKSDTSLIRLADYFFPKGVDVKPLGVTHVQITQSDDDTMEILFWNNENLVDKKIYLRKRNEYTCTSEGIKISFGTLTTTQMGEGLMPVSVNWAAMYLKKNTSGELVAKFTSSGVGLVIVMPVSGFSSFYGRFKQID